MPLSIPTNRTLKHTRYVTCEGYQRDDGLWDIEAHLIDTKAYAIDRPQRGSGIIPAGEPLHGMSIRITVDMELNILDAAACMDHTPFDCCKDIAGAYKQLIGLQIAQGFSRKTKELFAGTQGCTHLLELLGPLATSAFQATHPDREEQAGHFQAADNPPPMLNACHTFAADGAVVKNYLPAHYTPSTSESDTLKK